MLHKMRKQSKHHRLFFLLFSPVVVKLLGWPGKKECPTECILYRVFSSPLHSTSIARHVEMAQAKKSLKQISETFGIEFIVTFVVQNEHVASLFFLYNKMFLLAFPNFGLVISIHCKTGSVG